MSKDYETILETITTEQWEAIAAIAVKKAVKTKEASIPVVQKPETKEITEEDLFLKVSWLLKKVSAKPDIKGYRYLREALIMVYRRWEYINGVTKVLYPEIAKKFNTTSSRVEPAMRHSIEVFFDRGDIDVLNEVFTYSPDKGKPTNSEAIACMVEYLKMHDPRKESCLSSEVIACMADYMKKS